MLVIVDMGNTNIVLAVQKSSEIDQVKVLGRIATNRELGKEEYVREFQSLVQGLGEWEEEVTGCVMASTVPSLSMVVKEALEQVLGLEVYLYTSKMPCGIIIHREHPETLGSDIIAGMVGAKSLCKAPYIVVDFGTCTTLAVVNQAGEYVGGSILPGLLTGLSGIKQRAPHLPDISLEGEKKAIGTDTVSCIESGVILGHAKAVEGLVKECFAELSYETKVVVTGGLASVAMPYVELSYIYDGDLLLKGLGMLYNMR